MKYTSHAQRKSAMWAAMKPKKTKAQMAWKRAAAAKVAMFRAKWNRKKNTADQTKPCFPESGPNQHYEDA